MDGRGSASQCLVLSAQRLVRGDENHKTRDGVSCVYVVVRGMCESCYWIVFTPYNGKL